ncbi:MAG: Multidomain signal transduction protein including CheB-like methylesterase, CheR-like methyltransferase and BaeS-like histidine kinase [uncultured Rubrobacteraceae bacterium]|uniref:protein-glutamate O-methyltransferase n=1 Tax=uncultured Rubrobacteraceae bacterium TaxID=349277 RepID=A0A6J4S6X6_9ACTN|nr:MAG: Multidomain signal transduction protein including CheB-like methylesterase, CheR-like methyltransferase and BaeS-like histidine kinase [uncultured Rubrobacteraceae bacterium]
MSEDRKNTHLVVVGSSAGGIEALSTLVSTLPEGLDAPVVIAQHLHPERESRLPEILGRRSSLPVRTVVDHDHLEPGVVYVIPSNRHVNVTPSEIDLQANTKGRPKPSVDMLMSSAAGVFGEGLIAVVLTGTGSDGAEGARAVRQAGGTVIIQDPETAEFGGMPGSLAPNTVDIVADLQRVGPIVGELLGGVLVEEEGAEEASLQRFLEGLKERHGVDFTSYKAPTMLRRLKRRMVATDTATIEDYALYLDDRPEELPQLVNTLLIKVTQFFRNPELFAHLREEVLPGLIEEARKGDRQLRIWSAGCATGEEAYTLAIMLSELLGSEAALADVRIFATDIDREAVDFARRGVYPAGALSGISEEQRERYFVEGDGHYEVKKPVRGMIVFGEHDLARRSPFPRIDLVVSRNVLIYFTVELQRRALELFAFSLRNGGYLVLGKAETASTMPEFFASEQRQHKVYRREGERLPLPGTSLVPTPLARQPRVAPGGGATGAQSPGRRSRTTDEEGLVNRLPVGVVIVDRRYDILDLNAAARALLSIRGVAVGEDLLHAVQGIPYAEVRSAIDSAFRDGVSTTGEFSVEEATGEPRYLKLACHPQRGGDRKGLAETVAIVVNDVTDIGKERRELQEELEGSKAERSRLEAQNGRLIESNRRLEEANGELTALNDEMQASYEDALLAAEEAQAATEEVETLNEEMQATNEELETLNEELQATIEELNTTNDDLQARTAELQELARVREEERRSSEGSRRRLEAILSGMSDAVLAVGPDEKVLFSNQIFTETFGDGEPGDPHGSHKLGRSMPLTESGGEMPAEEAPQARAVRGESFETRFAVKGEEGSLRLFEVRGRPIDGEDVGGGVIVIREAGRRSGDGS